MNLPNLLTTIRFFLIPLFVIVYFSGQEFVAFGVLLLAGITDIADGYIARKHNWVTDIGILLDPLADKLMMLTVIISLLISGKISVLVAILIFIRDFGMIVSSIFFHFRGKKTVPANALGKMTTILFYLAILFIIFKFPFYMKFLWFVVIFAFFTSMIYLFEFRKMNRKNQSR
ncbi:CDP-alcohol phosphatidyltransferase family protein [Tepidibacillus fermentans]|uniref:CDP-diacylglycerol--glycerol-3-phosphate 3-phosphatidyltransferase n=1 Tax=Tepidibacillus fermentans TaxID=1281767 RepID=A0A4R3KIL2_9BACI|nr:CDP-alcohol phosphatidyltransferase family protein [Tepidibacillus fermentans]TCS83378.1 cardiolipin synthase [Tepidibacillus fermentans]